MVFPEKVKNYIGENKQSLQRSIDIWNNTPDWDINRDDLKPIYFLAGLLNWTLQDVVDCVNL